MSDRPYRGVAALFEVPKGVRFRSFMLLAVVYGLAAAIDVNFAGAPQGVAANWIANAIAISVLVRQESKAWAPSAAAIAIAGLAANLWTSRSPMLAVGLSAVNLIEIVLATVLIRNWIGRKLGADLGLADYLRVELVAAGVAPALGGLLGAVVIAAALGSDPQAVWWSWWTGSVVGTLSVSPAVLTASRENLRRTFRGPAAVEILALAIVSPLVMAASVAFVRYPFVLFSLPLAAAALRTNPFATASISLLSVTVVVALNAIGALPAPHAGNAIVEGPVTLFVALAVLMPFAISLLVEQQRRERARIAESEERFRSAMDHAAIGLALVGCDGTFLRVNRSLCEMLGYSAEELQARTFRDITHPDDLATDLDLVRRTLAGEIDDYRMEKRYFRKDGNLVWVLLAVSIIRDQASGAPLHFISQIEDITARKDAEAALENSESRWNFALESARQGVWDHDFTTGKVFYSSVWKAIFGYAADETKERAEDWLTIIHPDDLDRVLAANNDCLKGRTPLFECEYRMRHQDGRWIWILDRGKVIERTGDGSPRRMIGIVTDITSRRQAEAALEESESRWNFALDSARQGVWDHDATAGKTYYSPVWQAIFGYPEEVVGGGTDPAWLELVHPDDRAALRAAIERHIAGEIEHIELEFRMRHRDGTWMWVQDRGKIIKRDAEGRALRMIGTHTDITSRKKAEAALAASESRWSFALDSARQGVWDHDAASGRTFYSPMWKAILGYTPDEFGDESGMWRSLIHPDDVSRVRQLDSDHLAGKSDYFECEFRMRHKDGHWVWVLDRGKVIERDGEGRPSRMIGTHTDITSRKESEARIEKLSRRIHLATKAGGVGLWEYNPATDELWWDSRMCELYGVTPKNTQDAFAEWKRRLHPDDRGKVEEEGRKATAGVSAYDTEFRIIRPNGEIRHVRAIADFIPGREGASGILIGTNWDITEYRLLTDALFGEKERLRTTLQSIGDAVISMDTRSCITLINTAAEDLTGWAASEAIGQPLGAVIRMVDEATGGPVQSPIEECLAGSAAKSVGDQVVMVSRKGRRDIRSTAAPVKSAAGEIVGAVLVLQDVTEARRLQRQLTHSATHDSLTGLANRTAFETALREACVTAGDEDKRHALCFVDLDRFKIVNDTAGHAAGDALLREIGRVIRQNVRANDITARLGGDEFGLILNDCDIEQAELVARKIVESIQAIPFAWDGRAYDIGASIGLTLISASSAVPSELLSQADIACYTAKALGRNRVTVYRSGESDARRQHRDLQIAARIRGAIENDRFRLFAQEIRPLRPSGDTGRHFEVLLRMLDDDGTILEPQAFIPAAERYDLMANIDRWVFRAVLREYGDRSGGGEDFSISINLSANSLSDPTFWPFLERELSASNLSAGRLRLEITETALINNLAASSLLVESAQQAGCAIMLDDFGTGLSSFAYLRRFPIQYLKIDGSFMKNLKDSSVDRAIVESINEIAHKLGAATIAEWVEDAETADLLRAIGVDFAQGYAIAEPIPLETLLVADAALPGRRDPAPKRVAIA